MNGTSFIRTVTWVAAILATGALSVAEASDPDFQDFFSDLCAGSGAPSGPLAERCAETGSGAGDGNLSGDSESSLNPSQTLSGHDGALAVARSQSRETRERGERLRDGEPSLDEEAMDRTFGPWSLLVHSRGEWFEADRAPGGEPERGYDGGFRSTELGFDYRASERVVFGGLVTFERQDSDFDRDLQEGAPFDPASGAGSMESDSTNLILFTSYAPGEAFYLDGAVGWLTSDRTFRRNSVFQESGRSAQLDVRTAGSADSSGWWASLNLGREAQRGAWSFGPYGGITAAASEIDAYTERDLNGSGLNMAISSTDRDSVLAHLGFGAGYAISTAHGVWVPQFRGEWNHEFDNDPLDVVTAFALDSAGTRFGLTGTEPDQDYFTVELGVAGVLANGWLPFVDAEALLGYEDFERFRLTAGLRKEF